MTKKGKPKAKSPPKAHQQQPLSGSSDAKLGVLQNGCLHYTYDGTVHLKKALLHILASTNAVSCQLCPKDSLAKKEDAGSLGKQQQKKNKRKKGSGAAKVQANVVIDIWVCLTCGGHFCVASDIKADSHTRAHAKQTQHWWAAKYDDPSTVFCFKCDWEVPVKMPSINDKEVGTAAPDLKYGIHGLKSLGSVSCFNAVLQNLLSLKSLRKEILGLEFPRTAPIAIALRKLFACTNRPRPSGAVALVLSQENLLSQICSIYPHFRSSHMLDSEESFRYFLDALHTEEKESWAGVPKVVNSTVVDSVFAGQRSITISCNKCSHRFVEDEEFFYLSLPVPSGWPSAVVPLTKNCTQPAEGIDDELDESNRPVSIEDCLTLYTNPEPWLCVKCANVEAPKIDEEVMDGCNKGQDDKKMQKDNKMKDFGDATRRILISIPPPVLALHLKRFRKEDSHDQSKKLNGPVQYKERLHIGPFMDPRSGVDDHIAYRLVGVVLHTGGHYIANVRADTLFWKSPMEYWFKASDEHFKRTSFKLFEGEPHLLFYQKLMPDNLGKGDMKVIEKASKNKQGEVAEEESHCKEPASNQIESHPELKVKTPLPLVLETVEGSHLMDTHVNFIKGLPNLQNTCFFNVMLQMLLALEPLRREMLGPDVWRGPLAVSMKQLFVETSALNPARGSLNPKNFLTSTCSVCPRFKDGTMEDSHELLSLFLGQLREEEANARQLPVDVPIEEVTTVVNSIFGGSLSSTVSSIQCSHGSTKPEPFLDTSLPIPSGSHSVLIEDCWALYTEQEPLQSTWLCSDCTSVCGVAVKTNAMKKVLIARAPPVLVVTLKRFEYSSTCGSKKVKRDVRFKEMFDMQPFMKQRSMEFNILYRLVGVVQHIGELAEGHYVAYVKANKTCSDSKTWFYASDENIREVCLDEVLSCEAYILLYERCLTNASQSSANPSVEEFQLAHIDMQPHSSANPAVESQLADVNMQPQTGAAVIDSSPPPLDEVCPWEFQRTRNRHRQMRNTIRQDNDIVGQKVRVFLNWFILEGDTKPFYHYELVAMCERGSGSRELNIHYSHLLRFSKDLAMEVCNGYKRLSMTLKETAVTFAQNLLAADLNLTDTARQRMQQLASMKSASSLELKFLEMPKVHKLLRHCLQPPLTKAMHVYGNKGKAIRTPFPEKCALVQRLIADMISRHRAGFSWDGDFTLDDVDVYDDKVFISKEPKSFPIHPKISQEMVSAMGKDFNRIAQSVLKEFICLRVSIPYLSAFYNMLSAMGIYAGWWSNMATAETLRELIEHHPFLKPAMARSNLLSGIFGACRSYDAGDESAIFKEILEATFYQNYSWAEKAKEAKNRMLNIVFQHKDQKPAATEPAPAEPAPAEPAPAEPAPAEPAAGEDDSGYYEDNYAFLFEFLRHLAHHGSAYSFQYRLLNERDNRPRKQLMKSLDETEIAGAVILEEDVVQALALLLGNCAMKGLLESVWECYKNCNYPYRP